MMRPEIATGSDAQRRVGGRGKWRRTTAVIAAVTRISTMPFLSLCTQSEFRPSQDRNSLNHADEVFSEGTASEQ